MVPVLQPAAPISRLGLSIINIQNPVYAALLHLTGFDSRRSDCVSQARKPQAIRSLFGYFRTWQAPCPAALASKPQHRTEPPNLPSRSYHGESSFEWSSAGCSALRRVRDLQIRRSPLGFGSRRSVGSGGLPAGTYRQTHVEGWGGSELPCAFMALQLQRFESKMS